MISASAPYVELGGALARKMHRSAKMIGTRFACEVLWMYLKRWWLAKPLVSHVCIGAPLACD